MPRLSSCSDSSSTVRCACCTAWSQIVTTRDALLTDYFGVGGIGAGCVNAGLLTLCACLVYRVAHAKITGASVACLFLVLGFGLFGKNLLNVWSIVARRLPLRAIQGRAVLGAPQHGILRRRARSRLFGNAVQHDAGARVPRAARDRHEPRHRLRPRPGRRAAVQGAHGLQPVQHGLHRRHRGHAGRRDVQVLRIRAGSGDDLDDRQQSPARRIPGGRVRVDGRARLPFRSRAAVATQADHGGRPARRRPISSRSRASGATLANMGLAGADRHDLRAGRRRRSQRSGDRRDPDHRRLRGVRQASAEHRPDHARRIPGFAVPSRGAAADPSIVLAALFGTTLAPIAGRFGWHWGVVAGSCIRRRR